MSGLDRDRSGKDSKEFSPSELEAAEQALCTCNLGSRKAGRSLVVLCRRATNLKNLDWGRRWTGEKNLSDPYVILHVEDEHGENISGSKKTRTIMDNLNPEWEEIVILDLNPSCDPMNCTLKIKVFD